MKRVDAIIVGQGLAGTLLSYFLIAEKKKVLVIDFPDEKAASMHSSGIINPITGKRFVKSWMIDDLLPFAYQSYTALGLLLGKELVFEQQVKRILHSIEEINNLSIEANTADYLPYLIQANVKHLDQQKFNNPFGYCEIEKSFRVDIKTMLATFRYYLKERNLLLEEPFEYTKLEIGASVYKNWCFEKLIFCEGYKGMENPFFNHLPLKPNKGQYLVLDNRQLDIDSTITGAGVISPLDEQNVYAGATYEWQFENDLPTIVGFEILKSNINALVKIPYNILEHKAGIRPTSPDRRPLLGVHKAYENLAILNGFGAKGTSLGPYFAKHLIDHLWHKKALNDDVNIARFMP